MSGGNGVSEAIRESHPTCATAVGVIPGDLEATRSEERMMPAYAT
jgi:hypothetical protein